MHGDARTQEMWLSQPWNRTSAGETQVDVPPAHVFELVKSRQSALPASSRAGPSRGDVGQHNTVVRFEARPCGLASDNAWSPREFIACIAKPVT